MKARMFRKRPIVAEAIEWTGSNAQEVKEFVGKGVGEGVDRNGRAYLLIPTASPDVHVWVPPGWMIVRAPHQCYAWPRDEFDATYELVEEQSDD